MRSERADDRAPARGMRRGATEHFFFSTVRPPRPVPPAMHGQNAVPTKIYQQNQPAIPNTCSPRILADEPRCRLSFQRPPAPPGDNKLDRPRRFPSTNDPIAPPKRADHKDRRWLYNAPGKSPQPQYFPSHSAPRREFFFGQFFRLCRRFFRVQDVRRKMPAIEMKAADEHPQLQRCVCASCSSHMARNPDCLAQLFQWASNLPERQRRIGSLGTRFWRGGPFPLSLGGTTDSCPENPSPSCCDVRGKNSGSREPALRLPATQSGKDHGIAGFRGCG